MIGWLSEVKNKDMSSLTPRFLARQLNDRKVMVTSLKEETPIKVMKCRIQENDEFQLEYVDFEVPKRLARGNNKEAILSFSKTA